MIPPRLRAWFAGANSPYWVAAALLLLGYADFITGVAHMGPGYRNWALDHHAYTDILAMSGDRYLHGAHPVPYLHDRIEYPVIVGFLLWLPSLLPGGPFVWYTAMYAVLAACVLSCVALLLRQDRRSAWWIAGSPALLLDVGINWDMVGIFFLVASVSAFSGGRRARSALATALGTLTKLFPVAAAPPMLVALALPFLRHATSGPKRAVTGRSASGPSGRADEEGATGSTRAAARAGLRRAGGWLAVFAGTCAVGTVPFLIVARSNVEWFYRYSNVRPEKDALWQLFGIGSTTFVNDASSLCIVVVIAFGLWALWRASPERVTTVVGLSIAGTLVLWMLVNKVWNPQYILWVFAAGAIASAPFRHFVTMALLAVVDNAFEFGLRRPDFQRSWITGVGYATTALRVAAFAALLVWIVGRLRSEARARPPAEHGMADRALLTSP